MVFVTDEIFVYPACGLLSIGHVQLESCQVRSGFYSCIYYGELGMIIFSAQSYLFTFIISHRRAIVHFRASVVDALE